MTTQSYSSNSSQWRHHQFKLVAYCCG